MKLIYIASIKEFYVKYVCECVAYVNVEERVLDLLSIDWYVEWFLLDYISLVVLQTKPLIFSFFIFSICKVGSRNCQRVRPYSIQFKCQNYSMSKGKLYD